MTAFRQCADGAPPSGSKAWLGVLTAGLGLFLLTQQVYLSSRNPHLLPALVLLGALLVPAALASYLLPRIRAGAVTGPLLALTALVGGTLAVIIAAWAESQRSSSTRPVSALNVAVIEELAKLTPVIAALILLRRQRRTLTPLDGLILGAAAGTGFAVLETLGYAFVTVVHAQGHLAPVDDLLLARGLLAPATHLAWTSLNAAALTAFLDRHTVRRALVATGCLATTIAAHTAWDSTNNDAVHLALTLTGVSALGYALTRLNTAPPPLIDYRSGPDLSSGAHSRSGSRSRTHTFASNRETDSASGRAAASHACPIYGHDHDIPDTTRSSS